MRGIFRLKIFNGVWRMIALVIAALLLVGCQTVVTPPEHPLHPQVVYLCDYGVHSSLLLPIGENIFVEFLYGDWNWTVLGQNSPVAAIDALFFSKQATLGRRFILQPRNQAMPIPVDGPRSEIPIIVNGDDCNAVVQKLQMRWELNHATTMATVSTLSYVKDMQHYSIYHDCNHLTTECLRRMGCKVNGDPFWSNYKVVLPPN